MEAFDPQIAPVVVENTDLNATMPAVTTAGGAVINATYDAVAAAAGDAVNLAAHDDAAVYATTGFIGPIQGIVDAAQTFITNTNTRVVGGTVATQQSAQEALVAINEAIVSKDKIRAHLGAIQNRLGRTIDNLEVQAENMQAAESRISDVDVAVEMTEFVRNQILTQSAVAMLAQANSLPKMAQQLIGG